MDRLRGEEGPAPAHGLHIHEKSAARKWRGKNDFAFHPGNFVSSWSCPMYGSEVAKKRYSQGFSTPRDGRVADSFAIHHQTGRTPRDCATAG